MSHTIDFPGSVPELLGDMVHLRELTESDVPGWFQRASDPESSALSGDPIPESVDTCFQWLQLHRERFRDQLGIRWAIVPTQLSESVGSIGLTITSRENRVAELGAVIARAHWSKGIGTSAARMVIAYAFGTLRLDAIRADFLQSNQASKRVLEKLGFQLEHTISHYRQSDAGFQGGYLYILRNPSDTAAQRWRCS